MKQALYGLIVVALLVLACAVGVDCLHHPAGLTLDHHQSTLLMILLGAGLVVGSGMFYLNRQRYLERLVAERTHSLQQLAAELEQGIAVRTAELNQERARLKTILEAMDDGVVYREQGQVRFVNSALVRLLGYADSDFLQRSDQIYRDIIAAHDPPLAAAAMQRFRNALAEKKSWQEKLRLRRRDGSTLEALVQLIPVIDGAGAVIGGVNVVRDISREYALYEQRDRFITHAAHEFRRPLSNLKARLYLVERQPDKMAEHLPVLQKATDDMSELVEDLVALAQFLRNDLRLDCKNLMLQHAINAAISIQRAWAVQRQVRLLVDIAPDPLTLCGDYQRLVQGLNFLLSHAIDQTPAEKELKIRLVYQPERQQAVITIQDGGPGIVVEQLPFVFEPFFHPSEGDEQRTGLELTLAHQIVTLHGGVLTVESTAGAGCTFTIRFGRLVSAG